MNIKHRIELGNCQNDINSDVVVTPVEEIYKADTTLLTADNTTITADYQL